MIITNGVGFVHIQKTAGTSIRQAMMMSGDTFYIGKVIEPEDDISARSNRFNAHFNPKELAPILNNLFIFTCVRNPWDRLVSWYAYSRPEKTFSEFIGRLYKVGKGQNSPIQGDYFKGIEYNLVIRFETIGFQWSDVQKVLNTSVELQLMNKSNHGPYQKYYTPELINIVANKEKYVIERFGYTFK